MEVFGFHVVPVDANCQNCLRLCLHGECNRQVTGARSKFK